MKKITILAALVASFSMNAQLFSDDFQDGEISDWTTIDVDGDGENFTAYDPSTAMDGAVYHLSSESWNGAPLTPDNYVVSPAIDVTGATGLVLNYFAGGQDPAYSQEVYTVYVSTGNTVADFMDDTITVSFNEDLGNDAGAAGALVDRTLDVSDLDGATTVYVAFRHHDVSDQFIINFDDVTLDGVLGTDDNAIAGFNQFVDANNNLRLSSVNGNIETVSIYNTLGQNVLTSSIENSSASLDLNAYAAGVYVVKANVNGQTSTFKVIKK